MLLRHKLILLTVLCAVIPLAVMQALGFTVSHRTVQELIGNELAAVAGRELADVRRTLDDTAGDLATWSRLGSLRGVSGEDADGTLRTELERLRTGHEASRSSSSSTRPVASSPPATPPPPTRDAPRGRTT